ncbi:GCD complex subunit gcd7 [Dispira simplex]|nr:GCD complex subunit gcd7 [Dispira simplex]
MFPTSHANVRQLTGSFAIALETAKVLRQIISVSRWAHAAMLLTKIKEVGRRLLEAQPKEMVIVNIVRRVLRLIRDVYTGNSTREVQGGTSVPHGQPKNLPVLSAQSSMFNLLGDIDNQELDFTQYTQNVKPGIIQEVQDFIEELEDVYTNISSQAMDHIHSNEIIMTTGLSKTVELFLKFAAKKRKFKVIVAESASSFSGHETAKALASAGIDTTVIADSAVFAMMARVNKVIVGTSAVLANGGLISSNGIQAMAEAAKHHSIPVVVCAGLFKLSPIFPFDEDSLNICVAPDPVLPFGDGSLVPHVEVINPYYDYVAPEYINLFITNHGGHPPTYLYRLLNENYDPEDTYLLKE